MDNTAKTYCKYLFNHVTLYNGKYASPCCRYDGRKQRDPTVTRTKPFTTFTETIHSDDWKKLRFQSLNGIREPGCWKCYEEEERGNTSLRNIANMMGQQTIFDEVKLEYLEVNLGNHCNLACKICNSHNSDKWYKDDVVLREMRLFDRGWYYPDDWKTDGIKLDIRDYEHVDLIKFVGGEPMIHPEFMPMLDFLIDNGLHEQMQIQVFTNTSWVPKQRIMYRLSQFKQVTICLSIDGIEEVNDYSRWPSKWPVVDEAARTWIALQKDSDVFQVRLEPTLSVYNASYITDLFKWWIETSIEVLEKPFHEAIYNANLENINIILNNVYEPKYLNAKNLHKKKYINESLNEFQRWCVKNYWEEDVHESKHMIKEIRKIINEIKGHLNAEPNFKDMETFIKYSKELDKLRNLNIAKTLPLLWKNVNGLL